MSRSTFFVEEDKILAALFEEGLDYFDLRKPAAAPMYYERLLHLLPADALKRTTVHDNYYLKSEYKLAGIHIDEPFAPVPEGYKGKVGRTCRRIDDLKATKKQADRVYLRNVFDGIEEEGEHADFTLDQLRMAQKAGLIDKHVWALGGMTLEKVPLARELGFGGVVICGDLWKRFQIHTEVDFLELIHHFQRLRKAVL